MKESLFNVQTDDRELLNLLRSFGVKPGLERIERLLHLLDDPQLQFPVVHIAGTNGKGSTSSYITHIAAASGRKTGWFTSPYLEYFTERIRILDGVSDLSAMARGDRTIEITEAEFNRVLAMVLDQVRIMQTNGDELPTEFEVLTAVAFTYFSEQNCDLVVLETGMGGRLDSTNVCRPLVTVITALGYDHMERLGHTMAEIAAEKAGIIKRGVPVIAYPPELSRQTTEDVKTIRSVLTEKAHLENTTVKWIDTADIQVLSEGLCGQEFIYEGQRYHTRLIGDFQRAHVLLAIEACRSFATEAQIEQGIASARWPGRMEVINEPLILLDGAHNLQGSMALSDVLNKFMSGQEINLLVGILRDKQTEEMLQVLLTENEYKIAKIITTTPPIKRAQSAEELAKIVRDIQELDCLACEDVKNALTLALELSTQNGLPLVIAGSLYLVGALRTELRNRKVLA